MQSLAKALRITGLAAVIVMAATLFACAPDGTADFSGTVLSQEHEIDVPALPLVLPDVTAALDSGPSNRASVAARTSSPVVSTTSMGTAARVETMEVHVGDTVRAGDVVARLAAAELDAYVAYAEATSRRARAEAALVRERRSDVSDTRQDLGDKRADLVATIARLEDMRAQLGSQLRQARQAEERVRALQRQMQSLPPTLGPLPPGALPPGRPQLPDLGQLQRGIARLEAAIAQLDAGLARARSGLSRLDSARTRLADARQQLDDVAELARLAADASRIGVQLAEATRDLAVVRAPASGFVVEAAASGDVLATGAPLARIREGGAPMVEVWLPTEQANALEAGDRVVVSLDSLPAEKFAGRVTRAGELASFPPTSMATKVIHMLRATRFEVTLETSAPLPAGTPVDVVETNR